MSPTAEVVFFVLVTLGIGPTIYVAVRDGVLRRDIVLRVGRVRGRGALFAALIWTACSLGLLSATFYSLFLSGR